MWLLRWQQVRLMWKETGDDINKGEGKAALSQAGGVIMSLLISQWTYVVHTVP